MGWTTMDLLIYFFGLGGFGFFLLWCLFASVMTLKDHKDNLLVRLIGWPLFIIGVIVDVLFNWTYGTVIFWELPKELTLSERMRRHIIVGGWRGDLSVFVCKYLVEPWDFGHCGMQNRGRL